MMHEIKAVWRSFFGQTPKSGEIYEYDGPGPDKNDPFETYKPFTVQVVKVIGNYIKYRYTSSNTCRSLKVSIFKYCYKKV